MVWFQLFTPLLKYNLINKHQKTSNKQIKDFSEKTVISWNEKILVQNDDNTYSYLNSSLFNKWLWFKYITDVFSQLPWIANENDLWYVKNDEWTKWLPWSLWWTYYSSWPYIYKSWVWVWNKNEIEKYLQQDENYHKFVINPSQVPDAIWVLSWNTVEKTLDINHWNWVIQQVWQEQYWIWTNQSWSTLTNWTIVYANWSIWASWQILINKYIANWTINWIYVLWIITEDIPNWESWFVTTFWKIRWIDTSMYSAWTVLYSSTTVAWWYTNVEPTYPNVKVPLAFVLNSHSQNWTIAVRINQIDETNLVHTTWNETISWDKTFSWKITSDNIICKRATIQNVDFKTVQVVNLFTVPAWKTFIATQIAFRLKSLVWYTTTFTATLWSNDSAYNNYTWNAWFGSSATNWIPEWISVIGSIKIWSSVNWYKYFTAWQSIKLNITVWATATTMIWDIDVIWYYE